MSVDLKVQETAEGFTITVHKPHAWLALLVRAPVTGSFFYFFSEVTHFSVPTRVAIGIAAGTIYGILDFLPRRVVTTITKFEAHVVGRVQSIMERSYSVPLANISYLHYQDEESGDGETPESPSGLFAVIGDRPKCIVPFIDRKQTEPLIKAIEQRFGHVIGQMEVETFGKGSGLIQLNLK